MPSLALYFWQFNVKAAVAHHPIIQKEVEELLAKGAIEPSSGGSGSYSSVFVVPKHTGGLQPILNFKQFNHYLHIPSFKMPTDMSDSLFSMVIMLSPLISRMLIHIFLLLSIIIIFYNFLKQYTISVDGFTFWAGFSQTSLNLSWSFAVTRVSTLLSIWMTSWFWFALIGQVRGLTHFLCLCCFALDYILILPDLTFVSPIFFVLWGYVGKLSICQYLCFLISWLTFSSWPFCCRSNLLQSIRPCSF